MTELVDKIAQILEGVTDDPQMVSQYMKVMMDNGRTAEEVTVELQALLGSFPHEATLKAFSCLQNGSSATNDITDTPLDGGGTNEMQEEQCVEDEEELARIRLERRRARFGVAEISQADNTSPQLRSPKPSRGLADRLHLSGRKTGRVIDKARNGETRRQKKHQEMILNDAMETLCEAQTRSSIRERCSSWPNCASENCMYVHPRAVCRQYPNCIRRPGTCLFVHPHEDFPEQFNELLKQAASQQPVDVCRYGVKCTNAQCEFGHPLGDEVHVTTRVWCTDRESCVAPTCDKAHSSPAKIRPVSNDVAAEDSNQPSIPAQCRYGMYCSKPNCMMRHPKTATVCRNGRECTRSDCLFTHPAISEPCRYGLACNRPGCYYEHPPKTSAPHRYTTLWTHSLASQDEVERILPSQAV